jgi:hypothetical protein
MKRIGSILKVKQDKIEEYKLLFGYFETPTGLATANATWPPPK